MTDPNEAIRKILFGVEEQPTKSLYEQLLGIRNDPPGLTLQSVASNPPTRSLLQGFERLRSLPAVPLNSLAMPAPPPVASSNGIRFSDTRFSEPVPFGGWLPDAPGLYAILVWDFDWKPRPFRPIYFGTATSLQSRVTRSHEKFSEWMRQTAVSGLQVAYFETGGKPFTRLALERTLIQDYAPCCNEVHNPFSRMSGR